METYEYEYEYECYLLFYSLRRTPLCYRYVATVRKKTVLGGALVVFSFIRSPW